ncbi:YadA-like family protein [Veillonella sp.]|uniref:YadA-like family protein n=1 Tax=Veillonella sp. TaxID=1926307 RepID=UPI002904473A|nr:YadA-like family protein [Veillonella sp.]MDU2301028.1 YadA-like family protein [Veillonella sp.]MDU2388335.1 YadA-like family protein [Veillonella sp.]
MNKTLTTALAISALAVNVVGATSNNTVGGTDNTISATSTSSAVWGFQNNIDANNALAFGTNNTVTGENGFAGGNNATAAGRNSFAFGSHAESLVEYTVAIGNQARVSSYDSVAIGNGAFVSGESSVVLGRTNNVTGADTVVVGANNGTVAGGQSAVVGYNNKIGSQKEQLVFGSNSESNGQGALTFGTHAKSLATDAVAFGNNTIADQANSVAIGTNSVTDSAVGVDGITINGTRHVFAGEQPASVVSFGSKARAGAGGVTQYNRQLTNVSAGQISADSLDAVNGSQLFAAIDEIETNAKQIAKNKQNIKDVAIGLNMLGDVVNDHEQAIAGNTTAIANNTNRINGNASAINSLGQKVTANTADIRSLEHVADNHEGRITTLENRSIGLANDINNKVNNLGQRVNKLGASSAALAGLHPLDFNRNDKVSYAVSYGHYRNSNALALGVFARPNERIMLGFGATLGGENQYTVNLAFKTGKGSDYIAEAKDAQSRISKLEALVNKLMSEVESNK